RGVAVGQARIPGTAVASPVGQSVAIGISNELGRCRRAGEVAFLLARVAPGAGGIPMPGFHLKVSVLAISDRLPSGGENLLERCRVVQSSIDSIGGNAIDACANGFAGYKVIGCMTGCDIDIDGLGARDP